MLRKFVQYVMQSILGMIGISVYILADTYFISVSSGSNGLAVLNLILPVYGLMFAIGSMIGVGYATRYAIAKASGDYYDHYFLQSLLWGMLISIVFILSGILFPGKILSILGANYTLAELGTPYLKTILIASPLFICNYTFTSFVRNDKAPTNAMIASICGSLFNVTFDYILMFPLGLGFLGAAIATSLSPIITIIVCCVHFLSDTNNIRIMKRKLKVKEFLNICSLGTPSFVGEISTAVTTLVFNTLILDISGPSGVGAYGVIANIALVVIAIFNGIGQGLQPLLSDSYGKSKRKDMYRYLKMALVLTFAIAIVVLIGFHTKTDAIISVFNHENNKVMYNLTYTGMKLYSFGFVIASINIVCMTYFASTNQSMIAVSTSLVRGLFGIVVFALILSYLFGMNGIWLSFPATELASCLWMGVIKKRLE